VLARAVKRANENLEKANEPPLPAKLTPHGLRHTFCSLLYAVGEDARTVMAELGHSDPALSLRVYRPLAALRREGAFLGMLAFAPYRKRAITGPNRCIWVAGTGLATKSGRGAMKWPRRAAQEAGDALTTSAIHAHFL
jgi:hypothetical protein